MAELTIYYLEMRSPEALPERTGKLPGPGDVTLQDDERDSLKT